MFSGVAVNIPSSYLEQIRAVYPNVSFDHLDFNQDGMVNDVIVINHDLVTMGRNSGVENSSSGKLICIAG